MPRVVVDTNVVVSALLAPHGKPAVIMALAASGRIKLYYSAGIMVEYAEVISRSHFGFSIADQAGLLNGIRHFGVLVEPPVSEFAMSDESDRIFYDTAQFVDAMLITGNTKHYPTEDFIITPAGFLAFLY